MNEINKESITKLEIEGRSHDTTPARLTELAGINHQLAEVVASNVSAPPKLLKQLAFHERKTVAKAVVSNPNTPTNILFRLGQDYPQHLFNNPILEILFLENPDFIADIPKKRLFPLLQQPDIPQFLLRAIAMIGDRNLSQTAKFHVNYAGAMTQGWHEAAATAIQELDLNYEQFNFRNNYLVICYEHFLNDFQEFLPSRLLEINRVLVYSEKIANNPNMLAELATDPDYLVREYIASNLNTPIAALKQLANEDENDNIVRACVAKNPNTPISTLEQLANDRDALVRQYLAQNKNLPVYVLEQLASDRDVDVRNLVAINPATPSHILEKLATDRDIYIKYSVAEHSNTPVALLRKLAQDCDFKYYVARNPSTPIAIIDKLANDKDIEVRLSAIENPNLPVDILEKVLLELTTIKNISERYAIANCSKISLEILKILACDDNHRVCINAINNPKITTEIIESVYLNKKRKARKNRTILQAIASNSKTSPNILMELANSSYTEIRKYVASNENTSLNVLEKLAKDKKHIVREFVASNDVVSISILKQLIQDENIEVRLNIINNKNCTLKIKEQIFSSLSELSKVSFIAVIVLMSDRVKIEDLEANYNSTEWLERYAIAQNKNTPPAILQLLAEDCNSIVRATAQESLRDYVVGKFSTI